MARLDGKIKIISMNDSKLILYCQKLSREDNFAVAKNREIFSFSQK